ncbi:MAG: feruloyl-CoA synthase [Ideonella sp. WA131b]|nr:feruloyl-CoA synthase [Ideonella sp. WA131b]
MSAAFFDDPAQLAPRRTERINLGGGAYLLRHPEPLQPYARCVGEWIEHWARTTPDAAALAEPDGAGGWTVLPWGALRQRIGAVGQALLDLALPEGPVVVLSDNALDHAVLMLAAMHVGRPACTVSSGYSRLAGPDFSRLHAIFEALQPALVYASDAEVYAPAVAGAKLGVPLVFSQGAGSVPGALPFARLLDTPETGAVAEAYARVTPDTHAKYLLTSGSTGTPKVVINTQRMLCANQQMLAQTLRFLAHEKPVLLDWLPWSHTFGSNHNLNMALRHGGTLYIDDGRPLPALVARTLAHLKTVQPTVYFNVPRGYEMMLPALEADLDLAHRLLGRLRMLFYAGAGMPPATWQRLEALATKVREQPLWMTTSWGSTETAPAVTFANWRLDRPGVIGLPMPGAEVKFVPAGGGKLELRIRGDNVTPGYRHNPEATAAAFDEDGYYRIGDAGLLRDEADPLQGIVFDGRVAEDFKLTSGTWVSVGTLRVKLVSALSPWVADAVITGHDRGELGALLFLSEAGRALPEAERAKRLHEGLVRLAAEGGGSSQVPTRLRWLDGLPDAASGEITDKGYLNQRIALTRRAAEVAALHADTPDARTVRR